MQKKNIHDIDRQMRHLLKASGIEKPSLDFTENVMNLVKSEKIEAIKYKPIISSRGWITISVPILVIIYLIAHVSQETGNSIPAITNITKNIMYYTNWFINAINNISGIPNSILPLITSASFLLLWQVDRLFHKYISHA